MYMYVYVYSGCGHVQHIEEDTLCNVASMLVIMYNNIVCPSSCLVHVICTSLNQLVTHPWLAGRSHTHSFSICACMLYQYAVIVLSSFPLLYVMYIYM